MKEKAYYVYILCNHHRNVIYTGVTNNLLRRIFEHRSKQIPGFTNKYNVSILVYYEQTRCALSALAREKQIKKWRREKKDALINSMNPKWTDLSSGWD